MDPDQLRIRAAVARLQSRDRKLATELEDKRASMLAGARALEVPGPGFSAETIVLRTGRPVLEVAGDAPRLEFRDAESEVWRERLTGAAPQLLRAIRAVGRVEVENHPRFQWVGTGWLAAPTILVTNRHVASEFAAREGAGFVFRSGMAGLMRGSVDFLEEFSRTESLSFRLLKPLHIESDNGPDLAFFEVEAASGVNRLAAPIALAATPVEANRFVATIGYPARDGRIPDFQLMLDIFGEVFDKKRLAPGQVMRSGAGHVEHDCSTLGGNSGSVVLDLVSGEAVALHFAGRFLDANFAVPAGVVADRLRRVRSGEAQVVVPAAIAPPVVVSESGSFTCTIPLTFTVQLGAASTSRPAPFVVTPSRPEADEIFETEAPPESYLDRAGFDPEFLGEGFRVDLPEVERDSAEVVDFDFDGARQTELKYQNFSVVMNRARRMCFFSACNIDGKLSKKTVRAGWRFDSRIPQSLQIMKECYGDPPKFSRGHMTRREDPAWGSKTEANLGNQDSMHVTNTVPQMQTFNGGIWLSLEDYALQNAREDDMRISVITGPFLREDDPVRFKIQVPVTFWKVIAFVHDETGQLTATGYSISQESALREDEFVFGQFKTFQRPLASIEAEAGISFGALTARDPLAGGEESREAELTDLSQIRFV